MAFYGGYSSFFGAACPFSYDFKEAQQEAEIQQKEAIQASIDLEKRRQARHRQRIEAHIDEGIEAEKRFVLQPHQQALEALNQSFESERRFRKSTISQFYQPFF
jgi:hypothetical protein